MILLSNPCRHMLYNLTPLHDSYSDGLLHRGQLGLVIRHFELFGNGALVYCTLFKPR